MFDLCIELDGRPDALAAVGEALGRAGISIEGGGMFTVDGRPIAHFLVEDGVAAQHVLDEAGLPVTAVRAVVTRRLNQETPGQLGAITRAIAEAGARIEVLYSDHEHRLILLTSDQGATEIATREWDR